MSVHQPLFPASSPPLVSERSLPSSISSTYPRPSTSYFERLEEAHKKLVGIPDELSSERTPMSEENVKFIEERVVEAVRHAKYDTSSTKWTHVTRALRMACTSRQYFGVGKGVIMGQRQEILSGDYRWVLPENAAGWEECQKKWEKRSLKPPSTEGRTSKFFAKEIPPGASASRLLPSKAEELRDKVAKWQAKMISVSVESTPEPMAAEPIAATVANGKEKDADSRQPPLTFPATKHTAIVASSSKPQNLHDHPKEKAAVIVSAQSAPAPSKEEATSVPVSTPDANTMQIADVSEMLYLPPSFPTQLVTSTPPGERSKPVREKPPPIPRASPSPPLGSPPLPKSPLERIRVPLEPSSSLPHLSSSPPRHLTKRPRPITPPADNDISSPSRLSAPKKARTEAAERVSSNPLPPSSTPPPSDSPLETPPSIPTGKGLGNAKGLPIPVTPLKQNLPTLTELLASSRRSKPRPRPPSRKSKSRGATPAAGAARQDALPVLEETREVSPVPSAPRTLLSSPASGSSSSSPHSERSRSRSPASPLFTQNVAAFAPPFMSTQAGALNPHEAALVNGRTGSGFIGVGYSSQFDVEGQVGMVSDLLERDVDFDGWLRDMPEVDAEP
ncbi:hypothetical protein EIP86_001998 [Pleurotus ostreatoroseus]|nr:hypothetical protein EIP86_001998 [Pleurotus ostreatoroseus]